MATKQDILDAAFAYAERGWRVFPCRRMAKTPATAHGFKDGSTDPAKIAGWFANGQYNLGIATGAGLLVLDLDNKNGKDGVRELKKLEAQHGVLPLTLVAHTPSGGEHRLYRYPAQYTIKSNSDQLAPGVDIRADGGYIVAAPSTLPNGDYYWTNDGYLADLPSAWLDLLTADRKRQPNLPDRTQPYNPTESSRLGGIDHSDRNQLSELQDALLAIHADDYDTWIQVGMALQSHGSDGFTLWDTWSRNSPKYDAKGMQQKWGSFANSRVSPATIFHLAQQNGWVNPRKKQPNLPDRTQPNHPIDSTRLGDDDEIPPMSAAELALVISAKTNRLIFPFIYQKAIWWAKVSNKDEDQPVAVERISNCLPEFLYFQKDSVTSDAEYFIRVTRHGTGRIWQEAISPGQTTTPDSFNDALRKIGAGLTWSGSKDQLTKFHQEYWFHNAEPPEVKTLPYIGYVADHKCYLYTGQAVKNGKILHVTEQDYIELENGIRLKTSFRADKVHIGELDHYNPALWFDDYRLAFGAKGIISLAFWVGSYFAEQIRAEHGRMPFMEMCGEPGTGKSSVLTFLWKLSGRDNYEGIDPTKASGPGRYRTFEQVSNLPVVLMEGDRIDERGHQRGGTGLSEYKGMYNGRGMRVTGKKTGGIETHEPPFRASLVFAQNIPIAVEDKALMERIVQIKWDKTHHTTAGYHADKRLIALDMDQVNSFITACLTHEEQFLTKAREGYAIAKARLDADSRFGKERIRHNHAQIMAFTHALKASGIMPGLLPSDINAVDDLLHELCYQRHIQIEADSEIVGKFWDVVIYLQTQTTAAVNHSNDPKRIAINLNWLDRAIKDQSQKDYGDTKTLQAEIRSSKRFKFIEYGTVKSAINKKNIACYIFEAPNGLDGGYAN